MKMMTERQIKMSRERHCHERVSETERDGLLYVTYQRRGDDLYYAVCTLAVTGEYSSAIAVSDPGGLNDVQSWVNTQMCKTAEAQHVLCK